MVLITRDETPLSDETTIRAIIEPLSLPHLPSVVSEPKGYWTRYLYDRTTNWKWHEKTDVWLTINAEAGLLRRLIISGLEDEDEAKLLRCEVVLRAEAAGGPVDVEEIKQLANKVVSTREERAYQKSFQSILQRVRHFFERKNDQVVESGGFLIGLPISKLDLRPEDVALLRDVFARLPPTLFDPRRLREDPRALDIRDAPCPLCGAEGTARRDPVKNLKTARKKVEEYSAEVADEGFTAWFSERVRDKTEKWTGSTLLYEDYKDWVRSFGANRGEKAESKRTALTQKKWGQLMHRLVDWRRDGKGGRYRVTLRTR